MAIKFNPNNILYFSYLYIKLKIFTNSILIMRIIKRCNDLFLVKISQEINFLILKR